MSRYQGQAETEAPMMGSMGEQLKRQLEKKGKI